MTATLGAKSPHASEHVISYQGQIDAEFREEYEHLAGLGYGHREIAHQFGVDPNRLAVKIRRIGIPRALSRDDRTVLRAIRRIGKTGRPFTADDLPGSDMYLRDLLQLFRKEGIVDTTSKTRSLHTGAPMSLWHYTEPQPPTRT